METKTKIDGITLTDKPASGALIDNIRASYKELRALFGEPNKQCDDRKVSTEWVLAFNGEVFSIYDYKETSLYDSELPSVAKFRRQASYDWHIGGNARSTQFKGRIEVALATLRNCHCEDDNDDDDDLGSRRLLAIIRAGVFGGKVPFKPGAKINQEAIALIQEIAASVKNAEDAARAREQALRDQITELRAILDALK